MLTVFFIVYYFPIFVLFLASKLYDTFTYSKLELINNKSKRQLLVIDVCFAFFLVCVGVALSALSVLKQISGYIMVLSLGVIPMLLVYLFILLSLFVERKKVKCENKIISSLTISSLLVMSLFISFTFFGSAMIFKFLTPLSILSSPNPKKQLISDIAFILLPIVLLIVFCLIKALITKRIIATRVLTVKATEESKNSNRANRKAR